MTTTAARSVELRLERANLHLSELERLVNLYTAGRPYAVSHSIEGEFVEHVYKLQFTGRPDEHISVVVGDFLHNLRSALNYLMVGLVPSARKRKTQYPLFDKDPFVRESGSRKYVERNAAGRRVWHEYTDGVRPEVLAIVKEFQPYSFGDRPGHVNLLSCLNSLSNADKHRQLSVIPMGLEDPERTIWLNGTPIVQNSSGMAKDGTVLYRSPFPVGIEIEGTPVVLIRVGGPDRAEIRIAALTDMLLFVRGVLVGTLSPYLR